MTIVVAILNWALKMAIAAAKKVMVVNYNVVADLPFDIFIVHTRHAAQELPWR